MFQGSRPSNSTNIASVKSKRVLLPLLYGKLVLNSRGLHKKSARVRIRDMLISSNISLLFLVETHVNSRHFLRSLCDLRLPSFLCLPWISPRKQASPALLQPLLPRCRRQRSLISSRSTARSK